MKDIKCQSHTINEVAAMIENGEVSFTDEESRRRLAEWLRDWAVARDAVYAARVCLAKVKD